MVCPTRSFLLNSSNWPSKRADCGKILLMESFSWKQPLHEIRRFLAKKWLKLFPHLKIIAVTGSYGKTNTTMVITSALSQKYRTLQTDPNLDTIYNLPITLLRLRPGYQALVLECGVDHKGEMDKHLSLFKPQIAVLTGISPVHSEADLLGSIEGIMEEKGKLLAALPEGGWAILNHDDPHVRQMAGKTKAKILWYGTDKDCDLYADEIKVNLDGTSFKLYASKYNLDGVEMKTGLLGEHCVHEAMAAAAVGLIWGLNIGQIKKGIGELIPLPGRLSLEKGPLGTILLDDHLRANPASVRAGLLTLMALPCRGRKIAVLGEMGELGQYKEEEHQNLGKFAAGLNLDFLISIGPLQKLTAQEAENSGMDKSRVFWAEDVSQAAKILKKILKRGDLFYLKGSLLKHLERILFLLEEEKVSCNLISCHFYENCLACPKLRKQI